MTLPKEAIEALPTHAYRRKHVQEMAADEGGQLHGVEEGRRGEEEGGDCCAVCQADFQEDEPVTTLPCMHLFHRDCVAQWLGGYSKRCPICKGEVI